MTRLHNIPPTQVEQIRDGLNNLGSAILNMNSIVGDSDSRIVVDGNGALRVTGSNETIFDGKVGVGVSSVTESVQLETAGAVRFQGKKFEVGNSMPTTGLYHKGDIVWNDDPKPAGTIGWICIRTGTPGEWRPFGNIGG